VHCLFTADLHGSRRRYKALRNLLERENPDALFLGGDLFRPDRVSEEFIETELLRPIADLRSKSETPLRCFVILGNDDPRGIEDTFCEADNNGIIDYVHNRTVDFGDLHVTGYAYVPPTPFQLKDWEKYDVSRYVDPGCVSPEDGYRSVSVPSHEIRHSTIVEDLDLLARSSTPSKTIYLFHSPPYNTNLDRAALDGKWVDHVPLDIHVGSIAIQRFILEHQPFLTLHGHVHESTRLTGQWREKIGDTFAYNGSSEADEIAVIRFNTARLGSASRESVALSFPK
jgi:uncharacterized protein